MPLVLLLLGAAALGALHTLAFLQPWSWPLQLLVIAGLARWLAGLGPRRAGLVGWCFGTGWLVAGTWWLYISLHRYGGLPGWIAALAVLLLSAFLSLYLAGAAAAFARWRSGGPARQALLFAALWMLAEIARAVIFTGFPWLASGYAHVDAPLAVLAPWTGVYGIGFVVAAAASWVGLHAARRLRPAALAGVAVAAGLAGLGLFGGAQFSRPTSTVSLTLLQGNVAQDEKFSVAHLPEAMEWTRRQLLAARGELVIAPETVIPLLPEQLDPAYWQSIVGHFQGARQAVLLGLPLGDERSGYTNSAAGISADTRVLPQGIYRYDKHHLVPFGEFIPLGFRWFTEMMNIPLGDFARGPLSAPSFAFRSAAGRVERVAANICYEDLFGEELAARFVDPRMAPTLFANISNIGWFGDTIAVDQHLQISRLRALEFQRPMVRATNTGATVVIDHLGRVTAALPPYTQGVLDANVQGREGNTPFAWWAARFGLGLPTLLGLAIVAANIVLRRRARPD
jgi:apolipoprotein N-acyltransferase